MTTTTPPNGATPTEDEHSPARLKPIGDELVRPHAWSESNRFFPRKLVRPMQRFMHHSAAGGIVMLVAAVVALVWANSPWWETYDRFWENPLHITIGDLELDHLGHLSFRDWVNDALMAVFFFVTALEIKRELIFGDLRDRRAAALPVMAAVGGMVVPALVYLALNAGGEGARGWAIPMATDIAFALGVVALLGKRIPPAARIFLLGLAIADDIGAIVIIAAFYTESLSVPWLSAALLGLVVVVGLQKLDIRSPAPLVPLALFIWLATLESGVHATLAGVALGLLAPAWPFFDPERFGANARALVSRIEANFATDGLTYEESEENEAVMNELIRLSNESMSPLARLLFRLEPWVLFLIVPIFALSNAGVRFTGDAASNPLTDRISLGIVLGLVVGKTVGIFGATFLSVKLGIGRRPQGTNWPMLAGISTVGGIGFTVALFIGTLSFETASQVASAKIGILLGSLIAGALGYGLLRWSTSKGPLDDDGETKAAKTLESAAVR